MSDHLSDCSDDSFEIISHEPFEEPENEIVPFYKPKVSFFDSMNSINNLGRSRIGAKTGLHYVYL